MTEKICQVKNDHIGKLAYKMGYQYYILSKNVKIKLEIILKNWVIYLNHF